MLDFDNETWVGHGGSCPGYKSELLINPDKKIAYSVMINSGGTSPSKYIKGIHEILSKVKTNLKAKVVLKMSSTDYEVRKI